MVRRDTDIVEEDFALVERTLAQLVQGLSLGHAGQVEGNESDRAAGHALAAVDAHVHHRVGGDRAVRHPRGLLAADYPLVALAFGEDVEPRGWLIAIAEEPDVRTVLRLGDGPAADELSHGVFDVRAHEARDQVRVAAARREDERHGAGAHRNREVGRPPPHLFAEDVPGQRRKRDPAELLGHPAQVVAQLAVAPEHLPQRRPAGDHFFRRKLIKLRRRRPHDVGSEAMSLLLDRRLFLAQGLVELQVRGHAALLIVGPPSYQILAAAAPIPNRAFARNPCAAFPHRSQGNSRSATRLTRRPRRPRMGWIPISLGGMP